LSENFATFQHKVVFISDLHLGCGKTAAPYLYEYLKNLDVDKLERLYLVGDVIGGWEMRNQKQKPFDEMERRVLDILNFIASKNIPVHIIPGNHDEDLRPRIEKLQARKSHKIFPRSVLFEQHSFYETEGTNKKRLKVIHGDQFDPQLFVKPWLRPVTYLTSEIYDGLVFLDRKISGFLYRRFGFHTSFAKRLKNAFKKTVKTLYSQDSLLGGLENADHDGILMGHTHMAGTHVFKNKSGKDSYLINDGDWVESSTCAYVDDKTQLPKILHYKSAREKLGFGDLPDAEDAHPAHFAALRPVTDKQVRILHRLWPAFDRYECQKNLRHAVQRLAQHQSDHACLQETLKALADTRCLPEKSRDVMRHIMADMNRMSYQPQKKKLCAIFNAQAADVPLPEPDLLSARTIVREFSVRCERKIRKHRENISKMHAALDLPVHRNAI
jgi:UDP-2,3-diacylglucosamine pyrophosphatase LpxH